MIYKICLVILILILCGAMISIYAKSPNENNNQGDYIILVHGLGRSKLSMVEAASYFRKRGYQVINLDYPSTEFKIQTLSAEYLQNAISKCNDPDKKIHFFTHSLGGIIVRYYLNNNRLNNLGRVVMLSPPNHGSELADIAVNIDLFNWFKGPVIKQLETDNNSLTNRLGPVNFELGIITGNRSYNFINSLLIPGIDDGKVSIDRAKVENMKDFLVVPRTHTFIMFSEYVLKQCNNFIKNGYFKENKKEVIIDFPFISLDPQNN